MPTRSNFTMAVTAVVALLSAVAIYFFYYR